MLRMLRARKFDVSAAVTLVEEILVYRREHVLDPVLQVCASVCVCVYVCVCDMMLVLLSRLSRKFAPTGENMFCILSCRCVLLCVCMFIRMCV